MLGDPIGDELERGGRVLYMELKGTSHMPWGSLVGGG
jgi:hypothetical protein